VNDSPDGLTVHSVVAQLALRSIEGDATRKKNNRTPRIDPAHRAGPRNLSTTLLGISFRRSSLLRPKKEDLIAVVGAVGPREEPPVQASASSLANRGGYPSGGWRPRALLVTPAGRSLGRPQTRQDATVPQLPGRAINSSWNESMKAGSTPCCGRADHAGGGPDDPGARHADRDRAVVASSCG
jgi:hypothetical protein